MVLLKEKKAMKQLILTFFAVILCYSLFFDKKSENPTVDEINYIRENAQIYDARLVAPDTMGHITMNYYDQKMILDN